MLVCSLLSNFGVFMMKSVTGQPPPTQANFDISIHPMCCVIPSGYTLLTFWRTAHRLVTYTKSFTLPEVDRDIDGNAHAIMHLALVCHAVTSVKMH